jgi:hypothetical protein
VRIAFVILTFATSGFMLLVYFGLVFIVPYANTSEERAAAFGAPFSTEEFISRAKKKFEDSRQSERWRREWRRQQRHWNRQFQQMNEQMRSAAANAAPYVAQTGRALSGIFVPIAAIIGALLFVGFILALVSLIAQHTVFGWELPYAIPMWVAIVALVAVYAMSATVVRLLRFGGASAAGHHPGWHALHTVVWISCTVLLFWLAYTFVPGVREVVDQLMWAANLTFENISETIA